MVCLQILKYLFYLRVLSWFTKNFRLAISSSGTASFRRPSSASGSSRTLRDAWKRYFGQKSVNTGSLSVDCTLHWALHLRFRRWRTKRPTRHCSTASVRRRKSLCSKYTTFLPLPLASLRSPTARSHMSAKTRAKSRTRGRGFYNQFSSGKNPPISGVSLINGPKNE
jgi:hypothetical protein